MPRLRLDRTTFSVLVHVDPSLPVLSATSFATSFRELTRRLLAGTTLFSFHDMKSAVLTIRLDPDLQRQLACLARRTGRSRSELAREALRRQLALTQFDDLRRRIMPFAEARGYLTDEDVFRDVT